MINKDRLKLARERLNLTPTEVANRADILPGTYYKYESGASENTQSNKLAKIAKVLGVSTDYLLGLSDVMEELDEVNPDYFVKIPVYGSVPAGQPMEALQVDGGYIEIEKSWIRGGKRFFGLRVKGDSMYPYYMEGDIVICELTPDFHSGDDVVVFIGYDYEATLKRIRQKDGYIELEPINREYKTKRFTPHDEPVRVLGVVRELRRSV